MGDHPPIPKRFPKPPGGGKKKKVVKKKTIKRKR